MAKIALVLSFLALVAVAVAAVVDEEKAAREAAAEAARDRQEAMRAWHAEHDRYWNETREKDAAYREAQREAQRQRRIRACIDAATAPGPAEMAGATRTPNLSPFRVAELKACVDRQ